MHIISSWWWCFVGIFFENAKWIILNFFSITISRLVMNLGPRKIPSICPIIAMQTKWLVSQKKVTFYVIFINMFVCLHYILACLSFYLLFIRFANNKLISLLLVLSFSNTFLLKHILLPFQININKDLLENDIDLDDDVYTTLQMLLLNLREMMVLHLGKAHEKRHSSIFKVLIDALSKLKGIVANPIAHTCVIYY